MNNTNGLVRDSFLAHYGVQGMKWGERNGPPYPIDRRAKWRKETYEKFTGNKASVKDFHMEKAKSKTELLKGTKIGHVSVAENFSSDPKRQRRLYAYENQYDKNIYNGFFAAMHRNKGRPVREVELELKKDLKLADRKDQEKVLITMLANDHYKQKLSSEIATYLKKFDKKEGSNIDENTKFIYEALSNPKSKDFKYPVDWLISYGPYTGKKYWIAYIKELKKNGYDGFIDTNDQNISFMGAVTPFVIFEPLKVASVTSVKDLSDSDIVTNMRATMKNY